jgi:hypothetical protein
MWPHLPALFFLSVKKTMPHPAPQWTHCTSIIDTIFARASRSCRTLEALLAVLEAQPTPHSTKLLQKHPELAALVSHMAGMAPTDTESLAGQLHKYVVTHHAVQACRLDHVRAMEQFLRTVG